MAVKSLLRALEDEAIFIFREGVAEAERPVMLYSLGKDSTVMLHLARKAFAPGPVPFPLLHIDTEWKFQEMYEWREKVAALENVRIYKNRDCIEAGINPFDHGTSVHTDLWKTQGLLRALNEFQYDLAFGGARRDEEKSRSKERIFSVRGQGHVWDPKNQRPEFWNLYNTMLNPGESFRVFPLSNWTELDIWRYVLDQSLDVVPLYFSALRDVVTYNQMLVAVDDGRILKHVGGPVTKRRVRFRTLGCYPLTGAIESEAVTVAEVIRELEESSHSERQGRAIDFDTSSSMEVKKASGYF